MMLVNEKRVEHQPGYADRLVLSRSVVLAPPGAFTEDTFVVALPARSITERTLGCVYG